MSANARIRLAFVGMHPDRRAQLVGRYGSSGRVLEAVIRGAVQVPDRARKAAQVLAEQRLDQIQGLGQRLLIRGGADYPPALSGLPDAPDVLFCEGVPPKTFGIALVGTRTGTRYGRDLAVAFGRAASEAGWPVISGLARGVDGAAHRGTLEGRGTGVAVLGCGLDVCYPPEHRALRNELVKMGGCVLSEYPPGTPPSGWRFPPRNRVISGLSGVVVVIEARVDGGALITARRALDQGRDVFAVPGDVDRLTSEGCNLLIRDGAHPILGPGDMVESAARVLGQPAAQTARSGDSNLLLQKLGPVARHPDDIAAEVGLSASEVLAELARLEAAGKVSFDGGLVTVR